MGGWIVVVLARPVGNAVCFCVNSADGGEVLELVAFFTEVVSESCRECIIGSCSEGVGKG